jgi:hypothetical protein
VCLSTFPAGAAPLRQTRLTRITASGTICQCTRFLELGCRGGQGKNRWRLPRLDDVEHREDKTLPNRDQDPKLKGFQLHPRNNGKATVDSDPSIPTWPTRRMPRRRKIPRYHVQNQLRPWHQAIKSCGFFSDHSPIINWLPRHHKRISRDLFDKSQGEKTVPGPPPILRFITREETISYVFSNILSPILYST